MSESFIDLINRLMRRVPGRVWLAVGGLLVAAFWFKQHDARIRQQAGLQQLRSQTSAEVAALRKQAARSVEQANVENAKAIEKLERRRQQAEQQNLHLAAQLDRLRKQAQVQAGEVATLPISKVVTRVAAQLGLKAEDLAGKEGATSLNGAKAQGKLQITNHELRKTAAEVVQPADIAKNAISAPPENCHPEEPRPGGATKDPGSSDVALGHATRKEQTAGTLRGVYPERNTVILRFAQDDKGRAQDDRDAALALTSSGARKVETALVALDACRAESGIQTRQLSNCQARAGADEAAIKRQAGSTESLNQAISAKDKILARQETLYKAELRAARGTFLGRLARLAEHVAIGVGVGVAIGAAVK